ncbi:MAG: DUF2157 domain-containing protein [Chloroflexi bacterium]|nr:DUF2157 domain-containing protein [Chloroflexota bacterium]
MTSPPDSDPFVARLMDETRLWQERGIITAEQALSIAANYDVPAGVAVGERTRGRLVTVLAIFGSLLVGLGVILFFAANWDGIPRAIRLALIVVGIPSIYGAGYWLRYMRGYQRVGTAVLLLAAVLYGTGIHLVAQAYNFPLNDPRLFSLWFLGVLPLAYLTRSQSILILAQGLFLSGVGFWLAKWMDESGEGQAIFSIALYLSLGPLLYGLGKLQAHYDLTRPYVAVYEVLGIVTTLAAIYILGFPLYDATSYLESGVEIKGATSLWVLFYLAGAGTMVAFIGAAAIQVRRRLPLITLGYEGLAVLIVLVMAYLVVFVDAGNDVLYPVLFNALLLAGVIGLVFAGYFWRREAFINIAIVFFGLGIVTRYFELSWGLLDRSVIFILAGLILIGGGFLLERGRSRMIIRMGEQGGAA